MCYSVLSFSLLDSKFVLLVYFEGTSCFTGRYVHTNHDLYVLFLLSMVGKLLCMVTYNIV